MSKNTVLFILLLAILAIGIGYSKYFLIPQYKAQSPTLSLESSPAPASSEVNQTVPQKNLAEDLTDRQKITQLISLPISVPTATTSAAYSLIEENQPGFVTLTGQYQSTSSANKTIIAIREIGETEPLQMLFSMKNPGETPQLCDIEELCPVILESDQSKIIFSDPIEVASGSSIASSSALLTKQAIAEFQSGKTVLDISTKVRKAQLMILIDDLTLQYQQDSTFQSLINSVLNQILRIKEEYH